MGETCSEKLKNNLRKAEGMLCGLVFKKLDIQTPIPHTKAAVLIHLPVATIEVQNGVDQQTVEAVLLALKTVC